MFYTIIHTISCFSTRNVEVKKKLFLKNNNMYNIISLWEDVGTVNWHNNVFGRLNIYLVLNNELFRSNLKPFSFPVWLWFHYYHSHRLSISLHRYFVPFIQKSLHTYNPGFVKPQIKFLIFTFTEEADKLSSPQKRYKLLIIKPASTQLQTFPQWTSLHQLIPTTQHTHTVDSAHTHFYKHTKQESINNSN